MSIEAMKLAREIIQDYVDDYGSHGKDSGVAYTVMKLDQAIEQAQKQEPVGFMCQGSFYELDDVDKYCEREHVYLYTHPSPPQRQSLTDEEILILNNPNWDKGGEEQLIAAPDEEIIEFARAIEAKLKELNDHSI